MKRILLLLAIISVSLRAFTQGLPVLEVNFPSTELTDDYIQGEMTLTDTDGAAVSLPAKVKTRGATAKQYTMKPSFNMKLENEEGDEFDTDLLGLRKASSFILDAMAIDRICMRNRVCFDIWNSLYRLPYETDFGNRNGTVGRFVDVYLNGQYKGIYCLTDKINRKLLDLKKPQVEDDGSVTIRGVLYKNGTNDIGDQNTPGFFNDSTVWVAQWHDAWELHEPEDYPGLAAWQPLVEYYSDGNLNSYNYISSHFDSQNLTDYTLFIMALAITDNWGFKNKYFSIQNIQGKGDKAKFIVTPWDLDTSFGGHYNGDYFDGKYTSWSPADIMKSADPPFSALIGQSSFKENLRNRWIETRSGCFAVDSVASRLYGYCELFEKTGAWERYVTYWNARGDRPKYVDDLRAEIDLIVQWYADRHDQLDSYFDVDDSTSAVEKPEYDRNNIFDSPIYDIKGNMVRPDDLRPGTIYIQNGKKFIKN